MKPTHPITEAEILSEVISPDRADLNPDAAKSILDLRFSRPATTRMKFLLRGNNRGELSAAERIELEEYLGVGQQLDLLQAKARFRNGLSFCR
jgi:hypothetical protein